jgi:hypothetical protein
MFTFTPLGMKALPEPARAFEDYDSA